MFVTILFLIEGEEVDAWKPQKKKKLLNIGEYYFQIVSLLSKGTF